jgi:serine/threonine-protein kinase
VPRHFAQTTSEGAPVKSQVQYRPKKRSFNVWFFGILSLIALGIGTFALSFVWLNRQTANQPSNQPDFQLPSSPPEVTLPEAEPEVIAESSPTSQTNPELPSENNSTDTASVPIIALGTSVEQIRQTLGEPSSIRSGFWPNTTAMLYRNAASGQVDLGYIIGNDTQTVKQTEASFQPNVDLAVIQSTLNQLLGSNRNADVDTALQQVYNRQTDLRSFNLGQVRTIIKRNTKDRIYIAVWQSDFHQ